MIAQEFPDSVSGVVQKITALTQKLGKECFTIIGVVGVGDFF
jgi:hypothetical protein